MDDTTKNTNVDPQQDSEMDLESIIAQMKNTGVIKSKDEDTQNITESNSVVNTKEKEDTAVKESELSPLERMKRDKEIATQGQVVSNNPPSFISISASIISINKSGI